MNNKILSKSMLMIAVSILSALIATVGIHAVSGQLGLVKAYGPSSGSPQPYEPVGPFIDGVLYPQFLTSQDNEWNALKQANLDVYDFAMTKGQLAEYNSNICVTAPDAAGSGTGGCPAGQAPIQHEIAISNIPTITKWEIDFEVGVSCSSTGVCTGSGAGPAMFPTNVLAFRQAIAWITDKENFTTNFLGGLGVPIYSTVPCPALCDPVSGQWVDSSLQTSTAEANHVYGAGLPIATRIAVANSILNTAGFTIGTSGFRENHRSTCASDPGGCGALLKPFFYVRLDDTNRLNAGRFIKNIMAGTGSSGLSIQMTPGCTNSGYPSPQNYCEINRKGLFNAVFIQHNYNMYTGGWGLTRDPTFLNIYDPLSIFPGGTNYNDYNDQPFTTAERGLIDATTLTQGVTFAHAAELEYNASLPVIDIWSTSAPYAYRVFHADSDPVLNGLQWQGIQGQKGAIPFGYWNNPFTFLNAQLVGAPVHDPSHQVFIKYGIKTDVLDSPNPIESQFLYDLETYGNLYDTLNAGATDDLSFNGDLPWMSTVAPNAGPVSSGTYNVAQGNCFLTNAAPPCATGDTTCDSDVAIASPQIIPRGCSVQTVQLRPDLTFAPSLDGSIASIPVTTADVVFSALLARDDPASFVSGSYFDLQNVFASDATHVAFEWRTQSVFNRHFLGGTSVLSQQHWCVESHAGNPAWPGTTNPSLDCRPVSSCVLSGTAFLSTGAFSCPWPKAPSGCTTCLWPDAGVSVVSSTGGSFVPGAPVGIDLGSFAFVYDSQNSFTGGTNGPMLMRTRQTPGLPLPSPYTGNAPNDFYFTNDGGKWHKFHHAGNVNWWPTTSPPGPPVEVGPLPLPDMCINIKDLSLVAIHFQETPGLPAGSPNQIHDNLGGHAPWDLSGPSLTPDGVVNILDLTRVAIHLNQCFLGGTDQDPSGGGPLGETALPSWMFETIPGT